MKSLQGKTIVVTRAENQAEPFAAQLRQAGAEVHLFPTIAVRPLRDQDSVGRIRRAISQIGSYTWILFTSANTVDCFVEFAREGGKSIALPAKTRIGVIGEKTKEKLEQLGFRVDLCPTEFRGEGLFAALEACDARALASGARVLLLRARVAREILPESLRRLGAQVDIVPVYETVASDEPIEPLLQLFEKRVDCLTFTSPSTVNFFFEKLQGHATANLLKNVACAVIGPVTQAALLERGIRPVVVAAKFTSDDLVQAIAAYFTKG